VIWHPMLAARLLDFNSSRGPARRSHIRHGAVICETSSATPQKHPAGECMGDLY
jgi:hypothetical protein